MKTLLLLSILFFVTPQCYAITLRGFPVHQESFEGEIIGKENKTLKLKTKEGIQFVDAWEIIMPSTHDTESWPDFSSLEDFSLQSLKPKIEHVEMSGTADQKEREIVVRAIGRVIEALSELKERYPELKHFNEPGYFAKGAGVFLYDYNTQAVVDSDGSRLRLYSSPLEGGCAIYFSIHPRQDNSRNYLGYIYGRPQSAGIEVEGFSADLRMVVGKDREKAGKEIQEVCKKVLDKEFYKAMTEYLMARDGLEISKESLLKLITDKDPRISSRAINLLKFYDLKAKELVEIRKLFAEGEVSFLVVGLLEEKDAGHLPELYEALYDSRPNDEGMNANTIAYRISNSTDPKFIGLAGKILNKDTGNKDLDAQYKAYVLDYLANLPADVSAGLLLSCLDNQDHRIQTKALDLIIKKKVWQATDKIKSLINSFNPEVREKARLALDSLGSGYMAPGANKQLPEFARTLVQTLWGLGLTEQNILDACAVKKCMIVVCPAPSDLQLPEGNEMIEMPDSCTITHRNGSKTLIYKGSSTTLCYDVPVQAFDSQSIKSSVKIYLQTPAEDLRSSFGRSRPESLVGAGPHFDFSDAAGVYLLAAALKLEDESSALSIYEKLTETHSFDEAMLDSGLKALAWEFLSRAFKYYQAKDDDAAIKNTYALVPFEKYAKPHSYLDQWIKQGQEIREAIESRRRAGEAFQPETQDQTILIKYWIGQLKEISGAEAEEPEDIAKQKLCKIGIAALPQLFESFKDKALTRLVAQESHGLGPYIVRVGIRAQLVFGQICCYEYGLEPPEFMKSKSFDPNNEEMYLKASKQFEEWYKNIPPDIKKLTVKERWEWLRKNQD
jgi:hypothetical protein